MHPLSMPNTTFNHFQRVYYAKNEEIAATSVSARTGRSCSGRFKPDPTVGSLLQPTPLNGLRSFLNILSVLVPWKMKHISTVHVDTQYTSLTSNKNLSIPIQWMSEIAVMQALPELKSGQWSRMGHISRFVANSGGHRFSHAFNYTEFNSAY